MIMEGRLLFMFSNEIYKKQNGFVFVVLSWITAFLFLLLLIIIFMPGQISYPGFLENYADFLSMFIGWLCVIGFVGFPLSLSLYKGMKNLYVKSALKLEDNKIIYNKQASYEWSAVGRIDEKHNFCISKVNNYVVSKRWIKIDGQIEKTIINKDRHLDTKEVSSVKIARAFDTDQKIIEFLQKSK